MEQEEKVLLTSEEAAAMLRKSAMAFRDSMCRGKAPWSRWLSARRISLPVIHHIMVIILMDYATFKSLAILPARDTGARSIVTRTTNALVRRNFARYRLSRA